MSLQTRLPVPNNDQQRAQLAEAFRYRWDLRARPNQLSPVGDWVYWVILAGRGFGKTRTGAELVRKWAKDFRFVNLIGATADDARDIMIEGESGILAICPKSERPLYKKSDRQLDWPSGCKSLIFTADEPDRLRGKQHEKLWCLTGDTLVTMGDGSQKQLSLIQLGDKVLTRKGARPVIAHALTKRSSRIYSLQTLDKRVIIGTEDHPVWVDGRGFVPLAEITKGVNICAINVLNGVDTAGTDTTGTITSQWFGSMLKSGRLRMGQFQKAITCITSTRTKVITALKTWSCLPTPNTHQNTPQDWRNTANKPERGGSQLAERIVRIALEGASFIAQFVTRNIEAALNTQVPIVLQNVLTPPATFASKANSNFANFAESNIKQSSEYKDFAPRYAKPERPLYGRSRNYGNSNANNAPSPSRAFEETPGFVRDYVPSLSTLEVASVNQLDYLADVYDITVEDEGEFFANGILVHNCDELASWRYVAESWDQAMFGLRLGKSPQAVVTTTPRPIKQLKELLADPATVVTRGSTYDNRSNLAANFFSKITGKYENTRLGRQELYAEVLEDVEGALWKYAMLDQYRVTKAPDMRRIVVAIDPAVSTNKTSDETGIVAAGMGNDKHYYPLSDVSGIYSPLEWAKKAMFQYETLQADAIVAETNNGGDLVEANLKAAGFKGRLIKVHASKGKATRAEPVVGLYEQGQVHHVGSLPMLETQMTTWSPKEDDSPDRVDALVWAITELMGDNGRAENVPDPFAGW